MMLLHPTEGKSSLGGFMSILTLLFSITLLVFEFREFTKVNIQSQMSLTSERNFFENNKVTVNLDITFPQVPCELLTFDASDVMGNRDVQAKGNLFKSTLPFGATGKNGEGGKDIDVSETLAFQWNSALDQSSITAAKQKVGKEGCNIHGIVSVNRAPGHLHFGTVFIDGVKLTANHQINRFHFGNEKKTKDEIAFESLLDKSRGELDGHTSPSQGVVFEYFLKIVESSYIGLGNRNIGGGFEYSVSENVLNQGFMTSVYFRYDFSPVRLEYKETKEPLLGFLVRVFAIIGGIAGVMRLFGVVISDSIKAVKNRQGKLV